MPNRDAHFLEENQETGNQGPGNFLQEMGDQENQEKRSSFSGKNQLHFKDCIYQLSNFLQILATYDFWLHKNKIR